MIGDIGTVIWKEWREYTAGQSASGGTGRGRGVTGVLLIVAIISVLLPLTQGHAWVTAATPVIVNGIYLPATILLNLIPDSFAGERERHTLETLLASRLSDRAILFGKVGAAVAYGWAVGVVAALVQVVVANVSQKNAGSGSGLVFYPASSAFAIVVLGLVMSLLIASAGCLVSLHASTTRQAQLNLGFGFLVLVFAPVIFFQLLSGQTQDNIITTISSANQSLVFFAAVGLILVVDAVLLTIAMFRFQRSRLILM